ncbi:hypothetical protein ALC53_08286 [Atta colombica]|uniref:Uncharacterized protein n=1 Tax=Atta colombica TaxID=520822 RepID=A0A195BAG7_9HYME|nr:hypothetical protein ALC53_08286 [Atta colombica]
MQEQPGGLQKVGLPCGENSLAATGQLDLRQLTARALLALLAAKNNQKLKTEPSLVAWSLSRSFAASPSDFVHLIIAVLMRQEWSDLELGRP